jgi:hemoglobin-like flavoprotein
VTPEQIALVQESYESLGSAETEMAAEFYRRLFARDPELKALFTTDPSVQRAKFADQLREIVMSMPNLDAFLVQTRALGARHAGYGVRVADYATVGASLIEALAASLGESFDEPMREAWARAYNLIAEAMLDGAASARHRSPK